MLNINMLHLIKLLKINFINFHWTDKRSGYRIGNGIDLIHNGLTFCTTSGVPKSLPPCRRKPQGDSSNLDSLTLISCAISLFA